MCFTFIFQNKLVEKGFDEDDEDDNGELLNVCVLHSYFRISLWRRVLSTKAATRAGTVRQMRASSPQSRSHRAQIVTATLSL